jgi:hypothetical protein
MIDFPMWINFMDAAFWNFKFSLGFPYVESDIRSSDPNWGKKLILLQI